MPKGFEDSRYIPRPRPNYAAMALDYFAEEKRLNFRAEQVDGYLTALKPFPTPEDALWLQRVGISGVKP